MSSNFFLAEGLVISHHGRTLEYFRRSGSTLQFSDVENGLITSIIENDFFDELTHGALQVLPETFSSPNELLVDDDNGAFDDAKGHTFDLSDIKSGPFKDGLIRRQAYVSRIKKAGITKGQLHLIEDEIPRIAKEINDPNPPSRITVATWMRKFERSGFSIMSIVDQRALRDNRCRRSAAHDEHIADLLSTHYLRREPMGIAEIHQKYITSIEKWNADRVVQGLDAEIPISQRTLYRAAAELDFYDVAVAQLGREEARRATRFMKGHLRADRPLQYVEIDHALLDIFVIDDRLMIPLGRPWITVLRDRYSGAITGLYVSFAGPSVDSIFAALRHSIYPHDQVRNLWPDIETVLPHGLFETIVSDRGKDYLAQRYRLGIVQLGADYEYCQVRTPWVKGPVERSFLTLAELLETIPGKTFRNLESRKDYDSAKHAVCRFSAFIWILYKWAADGYNNRRSRTKLAKPIDLFNDGIAQFPAAYPRSVHAIETILGERHESILHHDGILFKGLNYIGEELEDLYHAIGPKKKLTWHMNNANLGGIRILDPRTNEFFDARCSRPEYADGRSLMQHNYLRVLARAEIRSSPDTVDILVRTMEAVRERVGEEISAKETSGKKRLARLAGLNSDSVLAGQQRTVADPFNHGLSHVQSDPSSPSSPPGGSERFFCDVPNFGWSVR